MEGLLDVPDEQSVLVTNCAMTKSYSFGIIWLRQRSKVTNYMYWQWQPLSDTWSLKKPPIIIRRASRSRLTLAETINQTSEGRHPGDDMTTWNVYVVRWTLYHALVPVGLFFAADKHQECTNLAEKFSSLGKTILPHTIHFQWSTKCSNARKLTFASIERE
jgi:hypothetical protein